MQLINNQPLTMLTMLLPLMVYFSSKNVAPPANWAHTKNWKIYELNNSSRVFSFPADSIGTLNGITLNDDSMHILLQHANPLHVPASPAWMGCYLTSCKDENGQLMKIVISQYGGFFLNSRDGDYYQLDAKTRDLWLDYMRRAYIKTE